MLFFGKIWKEPWFEKPNKNKNTMDQRLTTKLTVLNILLLTFCSFSERDIKVKTNNGKN